MDKETRVSKDRMDRDNKVTKDGMESMVSMDRTDQEASPSDTADVSR